MARIEYETLSASGNVIIKLSNIRGKRNVYTVQLFGTFGGGTVTAFINGAGRTSVAGGTTDDIAILDAEGTAISKTAKSAFDFECNSDPTNPNFLKIVLSGATSPALVIRVDDGK